MGRAGAPQVSVGGASIPPGAIMGLIGSLATQAGEEFRASHPERTEAPDYLFGTDGEALADVADPEARASVVLSHFGRAMEAEWRAPEAEDDEAYDYLDDEEADESDDEEYPEAFDDAGDEAFAELLADFEDSLALDED
jgi:hypothetical protein